MMLLFFYEIVAKSLEKEQKIPIKTENCHTKVCPTHSLNVELPSSRMVAVCHLFYTFENNKRCIHQITKITLKSSTK